MSTKFRSIKLPLILMTVPFFAFILLFNYVPLFGWLMAFQDYFPGKPILEQDFVGLKHFHRVLTDAQFMHALRNTLVISFLSLLTSPAPMILALLLNEVKKMKFRKFVQTVSSLPNFISWIIVYSVFFSFFSVDEGAINKLLLQFGLIHTPTDLLSNSGIAWYFQTLVGMWKGLGWGAIIYLAALSGVDQELYEAARVDGASRYQEAWHISLPGMLPTFVVLLILGIGNLLAGGGFEQMFTFMNPMVMDRLENLDTYTYKMGLQGLSFSYATAVGIMKSLVSVLLLLAANAISKRINGRSIL
ncbi:ABC transporter permease [Cohnella zeiphila]|uniref:Sugar ABC transporter permease n=1 Tax=Cohnella zeiphila TaxID=2761120 RepID=A0A7X0SV34_9BACL|nr:ABC transporter permease subunit [Cohnella zeiphila]MBB6734403.1 sugar ABC transporter permease [Cohnella zeiphila]